MSAPVRRERHGDVLLLTLDRANRLNAVTLAMFDALGVALAQLDGARAVLIAGAGRAFCSGADIALGASQMEDVGEKTYRSLTETFNPVMLAIAELSVPVVTAVRGPAAGIGCSLALAADFCVASDTAYFLQAFVNIGLVPDGGASWMLPRLIGRARAAEMMLLGERVPAATALDWGMIHRVVADADLDQQALALATRLAAGPAAMGMIRRQLHAAAASSYAEALAGEAANQRAVRATTDSVEGGAAFLEKRKPVFRGA